MTLRVRMPFQGYKVEEVEGLPFLFFRAAPA